MTADSFRFGKKYKLCSKKTIDFLFTQGKSLKEFPFVIRYSEAENHANSPLQIVISVPKRSFKTAVARNRIKRLCREAIRLNKSELEQVLSIKQKKLAVFLIYTGKEELPFKLLNHKIRNIFARLKNEFDH